MITKNNLLLLFALGLFISAAMFTVSCALRMEKKIHLLQPELIAGTLFSLFFIAYMLLNRHLIPKKDAKIEENDPKKGTDSTSVVDPKQPITPEKPDDELQISDLKALLTTEKERVLQLENLLQVIENQRDAFKKEVDLNTKYFQSLNLRYKDLLDIAGGADDRKNDNPDVLDVWHILISLGLHQYDYMKKISEPENFRPEQNANLRMVRERISIDALDPNEYRVYTEDARIMEWRYAVLRRRLQQVGIEKLDDVLISGVRI
jgi:hypothetical protein